MQKPLTAAQKEIKCYEYFKTYNITSRPQLRQFLKTYPISDIRVGFIEDVFSDYLINLKLRQQRQDIKTTTLSKTFVLSDIHIPFQDNKTLDNVFYCIIDNQPQYIVLLGDVLDCYSISRFTKRPDKYRNLQQELDIFYNLMSDLKKDIRNTEIHYIFGNHENRLEKIILDNPGLFNLQALSPEQLFKLDELDIFYHKTKFKINDFIFYHGDAIRKDSSYTAKAEFYDHKMQSGISAHTHRLGSYYTSYEQKPTFWFENGCLCQLEPDYLNDPDKANWQQGFSVIDSFNGQNQGTQILIDNHMFMYNGVVYE